MISVRSTASIWNSILTQRRRGLEEKIPDIKRTLEMVEFLYDRRVSYIVSIRRAWGDVHFVPPQLSLTLFF